MHRSPPERMTYAQRRLVALVEARELRRWCMDNGLVHSAVYRLAMGEQLPTYRTMSSMCHLIAPVEWLFYTDEQLPYKSRLLPRWDGSRPCSFVRDHRDDYREVAGRYGLSELSAYNIFVSYRTRPTLRLMRDACRDVDPAAFFSDGPVIAPYVPDRGDMVGAGAATVLVLTSAADNAAAGLFTGCAVEDGAVNPRRLLTFPCSDPVPALVGRMDGSSLDDTLVHVRSLFS